MKKTLNENFEANFNDQFKENIELRTEKLLSEINKKENTFNPITI